MDQLVSEGLQHLDRVVQRGRDEHVLGPARGMGCRAEFYKPADAAELIPDRGVSGVG